MNIMKIGDIFINVDRVRAFVYNPLDNQVIILYQSIDIDDNGNVRSASDTINDDNDVRALISYLTRNCIHIS